MRRSRIKEGHFTYIVVAAEEHKEHADSGWKQKQTVLGEDVVVQVACAIALADFILSSLVMAIQRRKVDIRARFVNIRVVMGGSEDAGERYKRSNPTLTGQLCRDVPVNDKGGKREHHA